MYFFFYAWDVGPYQNLALIHAEAARRKHAGVCIGGKKLGSVSFNSYDCPDVIVTGLSSFENEEELELGAAAAQLGKSWVVIDNIPQGWSRPAAQGRVGYATLIIASSVEIEEARRFGYDRVEYLGGPPLWQEWFTIPTAAIPRHSNSKVLLVGGPKDGRIADQVLEAIVGAMTELGVKWELIVRPHPREDPATVDGDRRARILAGVTILESPASVEELISAVDLSVFTAGSVNNYTAIWRRAPVIYFENEDVRTMVLAQDGISTFAPAEAGACAKATPETIGEVISRLFTPDGLAELRAQQEKVYPIPSQGGERVEARIVSFLEELVSMRGYWINHVLQFVS